MLNQIKFGLLIFFVKNVMFRMYAKIPTLLILAQAKHETGNFTSDIFKTGNNLFGMKVSTATPDGFIETGEYKGHAQYKNAFDSIKDYFVRQKHFKISGDSWNLYIEKTVSSGYAEDPNYNKLWADTFTKLQSSFGTVFTVIKYFFFVLLIALLWFTYRLFKK